MGLFRRRNSQDAQDEVDLREPETVIRLGYPSDCPQCGHRGYLDHIDLRAHQQHEHCVQCGHRWTVTERADR